MKNKRNMILAALAVVLVLCASIGPAMAYFTSYAQASGGIPIKLGDHGLIEENVVDMTKIVQIQNAPDSVEDVWIRFSYTMPDIITESGSTAPRGKVSFNSSHWKEVAEGDITWYYYYKPLAPGEITEDGEANPLTVVIGDLTEEEKERLENGDQLEVSVFYESIPVIYDENGEPSPKTADAADWDKQEFISE